MQNLDELKRVHDLLLTQTQKLAMLISPREVLRTGKVPTAEQVMQATADSVGLICYSLARIIEIIASVADPQTAENDKKIQ